MIIFSITSFSQDEDLILTINNDSLKKEYVKGAFKSSRVIMSHSMEMLPKGVLDFRILHRFGNLNSGAYNFFGLDNATIRLGLDYAIAKNFTVGIGRATYKKELDGFLKYRLLHQSTGIKPIPFSLIAVAGSSINTLRYTDPERKDNFNNRLAYYVQTIIGRKFSDAFTLQLAPILIHQNFVENGTPNDLFALGTGARFKLSKRMSLNVDYYYTFNQNKNVFSNPLSIGFDIETGGHVFQLHFTNATGMNERSFVSETFNQWNKGDVAFGFNISRAFQLGKN
jgi:hypothetical protein